MRSRIPVKLLASQGLRFVNSIIDGIVFSLFLMVIDLILALVARFTDLDDIILRLLVLKITNPVQYYIYILLVFLFYYFIMEATTSRTIGKLITGTIVVTRVGKKPSKLQIIKRSLSRIVIFDALSFLASNVGWHDSWSDTFVVKKKELHLYMNQSNSIDNIGK